MGTIHNLSVKGEDILLVCDSRNNTFTNRNYPLAGCRWFSLQRNKRKGGLDSQQARMCQQLIRHPDKSKKRRRNGIPSTVALPGFISRRATPQTIYNIVISRTAVSGRFLNYELFSSRLLGLKDATATFDLPSTPCNP